MSDQQVVMCSKSKLKRLDKKRKAVRVEGELAKEKKLRVCCEKLSEGWKEKALVYKRYSISTA